MRRSAALTVLGLLVFAGAGISATSRAELSSRVYAIGRSVEGRPIRVLVLGNPRAQQRVLVVGSIHGDEQAGIAIARRLERASLSPRTALWIVPVLNPDGVAANTRGNARGVDLNRNFPWRWRRQRGLFHSGRRPASEPETRAALWLIRKVRPTISIWYHQQLRAVDESGGATALERRYAKLVGLPLVRLPHYRGSVVNWENRYVPHSTAFVVELSRGSLTQGGVRRHARAVLAIARTR